MMTSDPLLDSSAAMLVTVDDNHSTADVNQSYAYGNANEDANFTQPELTSFYRHSMPVTIFYCLAYMTVFILGLVGNCLVVAVVYRAPRMRTVTNYFIVNLAIADILVILFCLPATLLSNIFVPWILGEIMCKLAVYVQGVSVMASIDSLVAVSLDRVLAICFPMRFQITSRRARLMILFIWIVALTTTIPWPVYFHLVSVIPGRPEIQFCLEEWPSERDKDIYFIITNVVFCYLLPLVLILICYVMIWLRVSSRSIPTENHGVQLDRMQQRSKVKVVKMLVVVVIIFMLSWLPLYAIFIRIKLGSDKIDEWEDCLLGNVTPIAQWLGSSNSCINPILYAYFNEKYRRGFRAIIESGSCCGPVRPTAGSFDTRRGTFTESTRATIASRNRGTNYRRPFKAATNGNRCDDGDHVLKTVNLTVDGRSMVDRT